MLGGKQLPTLRNAVRMKYQTHEFNGMTIITWKFLIGLDWKSGIPLEEC